MKSLWAIAALVVLVGCKSSPSVGGERLDQCEVDADCPAIGAGALRCIDSRCVANSLPTVDALPLVRLRVGDPLAVDPTDKSGAGHHRTEVLGQRAVGSQ